MRIPPSTPKRPETLDEHLKVSDDGHTVEIVAPEDGRWELHRDDKRHRHHPAADHDDHDND